MTSIVGKLHGKLVFNRRTRVLSQAIGNLIPPQAKVLYVGCGDVTIDAMISERRPDISFHGVDVFIRRETHIPVEVFDGVHLPVADKSYDVVSFIDVLHHTDNPNILLKEAKRVARKLVILKDHTRNGALAYQRLRLMDWVGNAHHNVVLPYNYWSEQQWRQAFAQHGLEIVNWATDPALYPFPLSLAFGLGLHCVVALDPSGAVMPAPSAR